MTTYTLKDLIITWQDTAHGLLNATLGIYITQPDFENDTVGFDYCRNIDDDGAAEAFIEKIANNVRPTHTFNDLQGVSEFVIAELKVINAADYEEDDDYEEDED